MTVKRILGIAFVLSAFMGFVALTVVLARHLAIEGDTIRASADPESGPHFGTLSFALVVLAIGDVLLGLLLVQALRWRPRS